MQKMVFSHCSLRFHSAIVLAITVVDAKSGGDQPRVEQPTNNNLHLEPFAVAIVSIGQ